MKLCLLFPQIDAQTRVTLINNHFGAPFQQVNIKGETVVGVLNTSMFSSYPALNGAGLVLELPGVYHIPPELISGCVLFSERGAILNGIIETPLDDKGKPIIPSADVKTLTQSLSHQTMVSLHAIFDNEQTADAFIVGIGKEKSDYEMKKDDTKDKVAVKGYAEDVPLAALDQGVKIADPVEIKDWKPVSGSKPPVDIGGIKPK